MPEDEYQEITLADIVKTLGRRKLVLGAVFLLVVLAGVAITVFTEPEYESSASLIPLEHPDIQKNWLESRHAAQVAAYSIGDPLLREMFPGRWDAAAQNWTNGPPREEEVGRELGKRTDIRLQGDLRFERTDRFLTVTVTLGDPLLARDAANAVVASLDELRPDLEAITRQQLFDQYYDGSNQQEAQSRAEVTAKQLDYWIVLDSANTPTSPSSPNVTLNIALSVVLGLMLAVFAVFAVEWASNYRTEAKQVDVPPASEPEQDRPRERRYS